jgi:hypothetical protein
LLRCRNASVPSVLSNFPQRHIQMTGSLILGIVLLVNQEIVKEFWKD